MTPEPRAPTRDLDGPLADAGHLHRATFDETSAGHARCARSALRRTLRAVLVAFACVAGSASHAQQIRGPSGSLLATMSDAEVRGPSGSLLYRLDGREVRDASGRLWLRMEGGEVRNASGSLLGRFDGREVRDASGRLMGRIEGGDVRDPGGRLIGRASGVSSRQSALYFFFLR